MLDHHQPCDNTPQELSICSAKSRKEYLQSRVSLQQFEPSSLHEVIDDIKAIDAQCFSFLGEAEASLCLKYETWESFSNDSLAYLAKNNELNDIVGYILAVNFDEIPDVEKEFFKVPEGEKVAMVRNIAVLANHRSLGIAPALTGMLEEGLRDKGYTLAAAFLAAEHGWDRSVLKVYGDRLLDAEDLVAENDAHFLRVLIRL